MPIPNHSLDDLTFVQLVEEAKKKIPLLTKSWTNYNLSDPGITLLELLAWLTENQIYSLNKIPNRNYLKFLKLLGAKPLDVILPKVDLTILLSENFLNYSNKNRSFCLPVHTTFALKREQVIVETDEGLWFIPSLSVNRCIINSKSQYIEISLASRAASVVHTLSSSNLSQQSYSPGLRATSLIEADYQDSANVEPFFFLFGESPQNGDCFYLQLEFASTDVGEEDESSMSFYLFERDLPLVGQHGLEQPGHYLNEDLRSELLWEYAHYEGESDSAAKASNSKGNKMNRGYNISGEGGGNTDTTTNSRNKKIIWSPLEIKEDNTFSFSKSGRLTFIFPANRAAEDLDPFQNIPMDSPSPPSNFISSSTNRHTDEKDNRASSRGQLWIRCKIMKNNFQLIPPRIEKILPNTVSCSFGYTLKQKLKNKSHYGLEYSGSSTGISNQIFEVDDNSRLPVLKLSYIEEIRYIGSKEKRIKWKRVDDLISSRPSDRHYVILNESLGRIKFGDGEHGLVPPIGSDFEANYKCGSKEHWWIEKGKIFTIDNIPKSKKGCSELGNSNPGLGLVAINCFPSSDGRKAESVEEAISRARHDLTIPFKAVTISDCEYIAKNTPGLRVGKVKVMASKRRGEKNTLIIAAVPYSLSTTDKRTGPSRAFQDAIGRHLEKHKLITTSIRMVEPIFIGVTVCAKVRLSSKFQGLNDIAKRKIYASLYSYFSLFPEVEAPTANGGWDFGRNVYRSEIVALLESLPEVGNVIGLTLGGIAPRGFHSDSGGNLIIDDLNLVYLKDLSFSIG